MFDHLGDEGIRPKCPVRIGTDSYIVPSPDKRELVFAIPFIISRDILQETGLPQPSSAGAVHAIIERIKKESCHCPGLAPLSGTSIHNTSKYASFSEPCTIAFSSSRIATHLWRPDDLNHVVPGGIEFLLRGFVPYMPPNNSNVPYLLETINKYADTVSSITFSLSSRILEHGWRAVWDQQDLRNRLQALGLVCFIGDQTRPARAITHERCWYRVAGPKHGVHIPFSCPEELEPVQITLAGSGESITGLGIKTKEIFAITGANAEGKTSLLEAIMSGEDDHATGDGREHLVTAPGISHVDATNLEVRGADISRFFSSIPPGMSGTPCAVTGRGSGSVSMAFRIQEAIRKEQSLIVIDEDCTAMNLLIPCYCGTEAVQPLSSLIAGDRKWLGDTSIVVAGSAMEMLIARCDRILKLDGHRVTGISPDVYRQALSGFYRQMSEDLIMEKVDPCRKNPDEPETG
jgi:predicted ABC-class ATPase